MLPDEFEYFINNNDKQSYSVRNNKWDVEDYERVLEEIEEYRHASQRLGLDIDTGHHAFADTFWALLKVAPEVLNASQMKPDFMVNRAVLDALLALDEYMRLHEQVTGDIVGTALAATDLEEALRILFDRLSDEQNMAERLQELMDQIQEMQEEALDEDGNDSEGDEDGQALEDLMAEAEALFDQLNDALESKTATMQSALSPALDNASQKQEQLSQAQRMFGIEPGTEHRLPAKHRIEMARKLRSDKFTRIMDILGRIYRLALSSKYKIRNNIPSEVYGTEIGDNLSRMLPSEMLYLSDDEFFVEFIHRWMERSLQQYKVREREQVSRGGIIVCQDNSGSMSGSNDDWSKAVALALLLIAKKQDRPFTGIHFSTRNQYKEFHFEDPKNDATPENILEYIETFIGGGTDFVTPIDRAVELIRRQHEENGSVEADVLMITDGMCAVPPAWLEELSEIKEELDFGIYGVIIGATANSEPLASICDGRVLTVSDLQSGNDVRWLLEHVQREV